MAAPKGEYTPKSGPLSGQRFGSYYQYQIARSRELYGLTSYSAERSAKVVSANEPMFRVTSATMRAHGKSQREIVSAYLQMRREYGGKHPSRNVVRERLRRDGYLAESEDPDWEEAS